MQKDFLLTTDACTTGISYILSQLDDKGRERVIAYGGRGLRKSEVNYTVSELECLAIIEGTRCYHTYLAGRPFTIITDHISLKYLNSLKLGTGRLQRWALHLQGYSYTVQYKPGKKLTNSDGLSRRDYPVPPPDSTNDACDDESFLSAIDIDPFDSAAKSNTQTSKDKWMHSINFVYQDTYHDDSSNTEDSGKQINLNITAITEDTNIEHEQRECSDFKDIFAYLEDGTLPKDDTVARRIIFESDQHAIIDGTLHHLFTPRRKGEDKVQPIIQQLCIPRNLRDDVIKAYHDNNCHIGFDKLYESIRIKYNSI